MKNAPKKFSIVFFVCCFIANSVISQNINIQFSASGASSTFDSIIVENVTQNVSVKLLSGDVLQLQMGTIDISQHDLNVESAYIYFDQITQVPKLVLLKQDETICQITIYDILGRQLSQYSNQLSQGTHTFSMTGFKTGFYIVNIKTEDGSKSIKFSVNGTHQQSNPAIIYENYDQTISDGNNQDKNETYKSVVPMAYNANERLVIKAYSGIYLTYFTFVPDQPETITIDFNVCSDASENHYATVKIGTQTWMAENLKSAKYCNGIDIVNEPNMNNWSLLTGGAWCHLNNDITMEDKYGKLYNFYAASDSRNPCPCGWHVPTKLEWETLINYLGGTEVAGGKVKQSGDQYWQSPNVADNQSYFTALPGRARTNLGYFGTDNGEDAFFYTKTGSGSNYAWVVGLGYSSAGIFPSETSKKIGGSIRCIKD